MIELKTGVPGSGKTLSAVHELAAKIARFEKNPDEARPVFVHGVKDLALPHAVLPVVEVTNGRGGPVQLVPDWDAVPDGALILIDEAQTLFPPRSTQSVAPPHVAWLNTHRHRGIDITVITQHPKLVDGALRALVGKHQHFRRLFGGSRSVVYEWDSCSDGLTGLGNAVTSHFGFPKAAFAHYKSAEVHTKQNFKLPLWLVIPFIALAIGALTVPKAWSTLSGGITGQGLSGPVAASAPATRAPFALANGPGVAAPQTVAAPANPSPVTPAEPQGPRVQGCITFGARCACFDRQGYAVTVEDETCRRNSVKLGELIPYDSDARSARPAASAPLPGLI